MICIHNYVITITNVCKMTIVIMENVTKQYNYRGLFGTEHLIQGYT